MFYYLAVSVIQSLGKLLKLLIHLKWKSVVSEGAKGLDDILIPHLLDHFTLF